MIKSAVRGVAVIALTTTFALLPTAAQAEEKDRDNDIERIELTGVSRIHASGLSFVGGNSWLASQVLSPPLREGDSWTTREELYAANKTKADKERPRRAGDGKSECSVIHVNGDRVTAQCTRVLRLKKGSLTLSDMITHRFDEPVTAKTAIIGGTGHYRSAYGEGYITLDGRHIHLKLNVDE